MSLTDFATWDQQLPKTVLTYNNLVHSEINKTPAEFLYEEAHEMRPKLPWVKFNEDWDSGFPNFKPFSKGQQVALKIYLQGDLTANKFKDHYH